MIALVCISAPGQADRIVPLKKGEHTFGAALSCEFLLLDSGIAEEHFFVRVEDYQVILTLLPEAHATLDATPMVTGAEIVLALGAQVAVGDIIFVFRGEQADSVLEQSIPSGRGGNRALSVKSSPSGSMFMLPKTVVLACSKVAGAGTLAACMAGLLWIGLGATPWSLPMAGMTNVQSANMGMSAVASGVVVPAERFMSDLPTAAAIPQPPKPQMTVTSTQTALKASAIVLAGIDRSAEAQQLQDGVLQVTGIRPDDPKVEDMRRALLADIPILEDVTFSLNPKDRITALKDQVAGVWAGKRPYVVRIDGEVIKPSQELHDGVILTAVFDKYIEVTIGPDQHKVALQ